MNNEHKKQRYIPLKHHPGIRKEIATGKLVATRWIKGKSYSRTFDSVREAEDWRRGISQRIKTSLNPNAPLNAAEKNGADNGMSFDNVINLYNKIHLPTLSKSTIELQEYHTKSFVSLYKFKMCDLTPGVIDNFLIEQKELAIINESNRFNFDRTLEILKTIFNWYKENYDYRFMCPILKRHYRMGVIKPIIERKKKMKPEEAKKFFEVLSQFYRDMAMLQFFIAGRIQEVAGLQFKNVDFKNKSILIKDVVVWGKNKKFLELKPRTKNGRTRYCHMTDTLEGILKRRLSEKNPDSDYVFHIDGQPLEYRKIQYNYNKALKACGLFGTYSSTHIMRHSMATITRFVTGSLDAAQAVTGHMDQRMLEHYAMLPEKAQIEAVTQVDQFLKNLKSPEQT